ncbi:hypothetical protein B4U80_12860 [Leptotrombidium deliense]|uniref:Mitochondrial import receptor subunit TOM70-like protein n=1 Tax=Leptotrombidium deliense TaxID=299467 RepID=A0A443SJ34_9ACAR|nr:hypothetical protein B4U80_12860 [Leptotrombidium deliense]
MYSKMSDSSMDESALEEKKGNEYLRQSKFGESIVCYSKAINLCDVSNEKRISRLYANRASANLKVNRYYSVIDDATHSFMLDKKYSEPLYYRYMARVALGQYNEALVDITAVCMLEKEEVREHVTRRTELLINLSTKRAHESKRNLPKLRVHGMNVKEYFKDFKNHALFDESYDSEKLTKFISNLENTPNVENKDAKMYLTEATISFLRGDWTAAETLAEQAVRSVQHDTKLKITAMIHLANSIMLSPTAILESVSTAAVLKIYEDAIVMDKNNVDIYLHRAMCYFQLQLFDKALTDLQRCIALDATFESAYLLKLNAHYALEEMKDLNGVKKVFKQFEKYIGVHPHSIDAPIQYSNLLHQSGKAEKAANIISKALKLNPDNSDLLKEKAEFLIEKDPQAARPLLLKALPSTNVYKRELFAMMAFVAAEHGEFNEALIYSDKAISETRNENDLLSCILRREKLSSILYACNLLGIEANKENCSSVIKQLAIRKKKLTSHKQALFAHIPSLSNEIDDVLFGFYIQLYFASLF